MAMNEHSRFIEDKRVLEEFSVIAWQSVHPASTPLVGTLDVLGWSGLYFAPLSEIPETNVAEEQLSGSGVHIPLVANQVNVSDLSLSPETTLAIILVQIRQKVKLCVEIC
jgi:hypothetical protein